MDCARLNRQLHVTDNRGAVGQCQEPVITSVVQQLSRQVRKLRTARKPEPDPQRGLLFLGTVQATAQALTHRSGEDSIEQLTAEQLRSHDWGGFNTPGPRPEPSHLQDEVLQLNVSEWPHERNRLAITGRRPQYLRLVAALGTPEQHINV